MAEFNRARHLKIINQFKVLQIKSKLQKQLRQRNYKKLAPGVEGTVVVVQWWPNESLSL